MVINHLLTGMILQVMPTIISPKSRVFRRWPSATAQPWWRSWWTEVWMGKTKNPAPEKEQESKKNPQQKVVEGEKKSRRFVDWARKCWKIKKLCLFWGVFLRENFWFIRRNYEANAAGWKVGMLKAIVNSSWIHPRKLTWISKIAIFERRYLLNTIIFGIYVRFRVGIYYL